MTLQQHIVDVKVIEKEEMLQEKRFGRQSDNPRYKAVIRCNLSMSIS